MLKPTYLCLQTRMNMMKYRLYLIIRSLSKNSIQFRQSLIISFINFSQLLHLRVYTKSFSNNFKCHSLQFPKYFLLIFYSRRWTTLLRFKLIFKSFNLIQIHKISKRFRFFYFTFIFCCISHIKHLFIYISILRSLS